MNTGEDLLPPHSFRHRLEELLNRRSSFIVLVAVLIGLKLVLMGLFSSDYQNKMFEPFVAEFISGWRDGFSNPYQSFYIRGENMDFPYPPVMLVIMSFGQGLCMLFSGLPLFLRNILFKLPLLLMDCLVFRKLCVMYPEKRISATLIYFASPVIFYAAYMHGQLDIIPMAFLLLALVYLINMTSAKNFYISAFFLSLALLSKFHIAAVLPLIAIYIFKHHGYIKTIRYCLLTIAVTIAGVIPFYGQGFINGVIFNTAQSSLFALYFSYGSLKLYASLAAIVIVYFYALNLNFINSELLFGFVGMIFSVFLALCAPMPGWYMWVMVFIADFIIRSNGQNYSFMCYMLLQVFYLVFFLFFHQSESGAVDLYFLETDLSFLKMDIPYLKDIFFTLLSATLLYVIYLMHKFCIAGNSLYNFHDSAFVIGICGDSGTGKTTLQNFISNMFDQHKLLRIEGDGDHKWERGDSNWENYTHLNPQANYLYRQAMDIRRLKKGEAVKRVDYDHNTGRFTSRLTVYPRRFISISGLHIFYLPQLRNIVDLKIYMDLEEDLRIIWKMDRDTEKRGYTRDDIIRQIQSRSEDAKKYIHPQREFADIVIHYFLDDAEKQTVGMTVTVDTKIDIENVVSALTRAGAVISYEFSEDFRYNMITYCPSLNKDAPPVDFKNVFSELFERGYDIISRPFEVNSAVEGICGLILVQAIISVLRGDVQ